MDCGCCYNVEYILLPSIVVAHIVALVFLRRIKYSKRYKNPVIIITTICIFELTGAVLIISYYTFDNFVSSFAADIILYFIEILIVLSFYFTMDLLTVDRF